MSVLFHTSLKTLHSDVLFLEGHVLLLKHKHTLVYIDRNSSSTTSFIYCLPIMHQPDALQKGQDSQQLLAVLTVCSISNLEVVNLLRLLPSTLAILCSHHPLKSTLVYVCTVHYPRYRIWMTLCFSKYVILLSCLWKGSVMVSDLDQDTAQYFSRTVWQLYVKNCQTQKSVVSPF